MPHEMGEEIEFYLGEQLGLVVKLDLETLAVEDQRTYL